MNIELLPFGNVTALAFIVLVALLLCSALLELVFVAIKYVFSLDNENAPKVKFTNYIFKFVDYVLIKNIPYNYIVRVSTRYNGTWEVFATHSNKIYGYHFSESISEDQADTLNQRKEGKYLQELRWWILLLLVAADIFVLLFGYFPVLSISLGSVAVLGFGLRKFSAWTYGTFNTHKNKLDEHDKDIESLKSSK